MSELYLMAVITDRHRWRDYYRFYKSHGIEITLSTVGAGTAANEVLSYFGLEETEKVIIFSFVTRATWRRLKEGLEQTMNIDVPGTGIAFIVPLSSIGGKKPLMFLTENQHFVKGEEATLKDTTYELVVIISNQGYTDLVMEAAHKGGAAGATVIHAKGTGMERAERFLGFSLGSEKEMIFIVTKSEAKDGIMRSVMDQAGLESKARSLVFTLPVTAAAGMRLMEWRPEEESEEA